MPIVRDIDGVEFHCDLGRLTIITTRERGEIVRCEAYASGYLYEIAPDVAEQLRAEQLRANTHHDRFAGDA